MFSEIWEWDNEKFVIDQKRWLPDTNVKKIKKSWVQTFKKPQMKTFRQEGYERFRIKLDYFFSISLGTNILGNLGTSDFCNLSTGVFYNLHVSKFFFYRTSEMIRPNLHTNITPCIMNSSNTIHRKFPYICSGILECFGILPWFFLTEFHPFSALCHWSAGVCRDAWS